MGVITWAFLAFAYEAKEDTIHPDPQSALYKDAYVVAYYVPTPVKFYDPPKWVLSSCINTAKWILLGSLTEQTWGNAKDLKPIPELLPAPGVIGITDEGQGHIFVIKSVSGSVLSVLEGNFIPNQLSTRTLNIDDPRIKGYWLP